MGIIYRPGDIPEDDAPPPAGLALGDTWFWHGDQTLLHALVEHPRVAPDHAAVRLLGFNGALLNAYIGDGACADVMRTHLAGSPPFSEFYISGFANDALEHGLALRDDCARARDPAACFSAERLDLLLYHIDIGLNGIIRTLRWAYRHTARLQPVFLNGYDYPVPDGRSFVNAHGGWITALMNAAHVDPDLAFRTRVMRHLIDVVNDDVLAAFHSPLARVFHVDSRGCLATFPERYQDDWENELYPTREGFTRILEQAWLPRLAPFGIAVTGT